MRAIVWSDRIAMFLFVEGALLGALMYFFYLLDGFVLSVTPIGIGAAVLSAWGGTHYLRRSHRIMERIQGRSVRHRTIAMRLCAIPPFVVGGYCAAAALVAYALRAHGYVSVTSTIVEIWVGLSVAGLVAGSLLFFDSERTIIRRLVAVQERLAVGAKS